VAAIVLVGPKQGAERPAGRPAGDVRPLYGGTLEPGVRYGSVALVPSVSFSVGDKGWLAKATEGSDLVLLEREAGRDAAGAPNPARAGMSFSRLREVYDPATGKAVPAPADILGWLRAHPDIDAGRPRPVRLAGLDGQVLDLTFRFTKPALEELMCRDLQTARCTLLAPGEWHLNGAMERVYVLDSDPGPLVVAVEGFDAAAFRGAQAAAQPILDSLEVTRP
jgi:hypothetical protein